MRFWQEWVYRMACCGREVGRGKLYNANPPQFEIMRDCGHCEMPEGYTSTCHRYLVAEGVEEEAA